MISNILKSVESIGGLQLDKHVIQKLDDPISIWNKFADSYDLGETIKKDIAEEFANAIKWQSADNDIKQQCSFSHLVLHSLFVRAPR